MNKLLRSRQSGQAIGLAAVVMVAMVGMLALVVDSGIFIETQRELQKSVDSAAMAGIFQVPSNRNLAVSMADDFAAQNMPIAARLCRTTPTESDNSLTATPGMYTPGADMYYSLTVTAYCDVGFSFGRILDFLQMRVQATATAALGSVAAAECPFPFAVNEAMPNSGGASNRFGYPLAPATTSFLLGSQPGFYLTCLEAGENCGANGSTDGPGIRQWLSGHPCQELSTGHVYLFALGTDQSIASGPVLQGFGDRDIPFNVSGNTATCPDAFSAVVAPNGAVIQQSTCLAVLPVIQYGEAPNGNSSPVTIIGFVPFFIQQYTKVGGNDFWLTGYVVNSNFRAQMGGYNSTSNLMARLIR
jgi:hypothetical protein